MKERTSIAIFVIVLLLIGFGAAYWSLFVTSFTFHQSEINAENTTIRETLSFKPDKPYHTLYRYFVSPIQASSIQTGEQGRIEKINIHSVTCTAGEAYVKTNFGECFYKKNTEFQQSQCKPFTENNELGCTFGSELGFQKNQEYTVQSIYTIQAPAVIKIKENYYLKFVAYSSNKHPLLIKGKNFIINDDNIIAKSFYLPSQKVIIYIPYNGEINNATIIEENPVDFSFLLLLLYFVLGAFPAAGILIVWLLFGKETTEADLPETLSYWPQTKRKAWEVATYFHPPFGVMDKEFFASTILDLSRRKIVKLVTKEKEAWIKIPDTLPEGLDETETKFLKLLIKMQKKLMEDYSKNKKAFKWKVSRFFIGKPEDFVDDKNFVNLEKLVVYAQSYRTEILDFQKEIKKKSKAYLDYTGEYAALAVLIISVTLILIALNPILLIWGVIILFTIISAIMKNSALFTRFKGDFCKEYRHWQAFRKYLKEFPSMKEAPHEAIVLWDQYLVYATALGVSEQILKKFKEWKIINESQYNSFHSVGLYSASFSTSAGTSGGGGGVGGGGVGGGGGGGR